MIRPLAVLALVAIAAAPARADEPPWAVGVSEERKAAAEKLLDEGNARFLEHHFSEALDAYRKALVEWDHPAIRFNIVRCLIQLDRAVEASEQLDAALKYGAAPLGDALFAEATGYQKLLAGQIGELEVTCTQPGVAIRLDGQPLATCPADEHRRVSPGTHQVVGTHAGYLTHTSDATVIGGKQLRVAVELVPLEKAAHVVHRWQTWVPWTVFGSGFVVAGIGGVLELNAVSFRDAYDRAVAQACMPVACAPGTKIDQHDLDREKLYNGIAIGVISAGILTVAAGAGMLYLNRGHTIYPDLQPTRTGATIGVAGRF